MISTDFGLYFPSMCFKYGCKDIPFVREICQEKHTSETHHFEKDSNYNFEKLKTSRFSILFKPQNDERNHYETRVKNKQPPNKTKAYTKHYTPNQIKQGLTYPTITCIFRKIDNRNKLFHLCIKYTKLNIQIAIALLDSLRVERYLRRLDILNCKASVNVIYSLIKLIIVSNITELNLDNCYMPELNCVSLLEGTKSLKILSLKNSCINDCGVKHIAKQLHHFKTPAKNLEVLNLSSNVITNYGAKCIAKCLRSNRRLTSLTLANNLIRDEGCCEISKSMKCFCLTDKEMDSKKERNIEYLIKRQETFEVYVQLKLNTVETKSTAFELATSNNSDDEDETEKQSIPEQCENTTRSNNLCIDEIIEKHLGANINDYPFRGSELFCKNENVYCKGNNTLTHLNLAFNCIGHRGIRHIINAIRYQNKYGRKRENINILLEGNPNVLKLPEYHILSDLI